MTAKFLCLQDSTAGDSGYDIYENIYAHFQIFYSSCSLCLQAGAAGNSGSDINSLLARNGVGMNLGNKKAGREEEIHKMQLFDQILYRNHDF